MKATIKNNNDESYYIMIFLIAVLQCADVSSFSSIYSIISPILRLLIGILSVEQFLSCKGRMNKGQILIIFFILLGMYTFIRTDTSWLVYLFIEVLFIKNKDIERIIRIVCIVTTFIFVANFLVFLYQYYIGDMNNLLFYQRYGESIKRWHIFYSSPNGASRHFIFIAVGWLFLNNNKITIKSGVLLVILTTIIFCFTKSDAVFFVPILIILSIVSQKIEDGCKLLRILRKTVFFFGISLTFVYVLLCEMELSQLMLYINRFLTGRLTGVYMGYIKYGITLLGQETQSGYQLVNGIPYILNVDNAYMYCCIRYGVIYLFYFLMVIYKSSKKYLSARNEIVLIIYGLYMMIENRFVDFPTSIPLIIVFHAYFNNSKCLEHKSGKDEYEIILRHQGERFHVPGY